MDDVIAPIVRERIFITGASGFIGGAIARALARTRDVHALSRSAASDDLIRSLEATPVRQTLGSVDAASLSGCTAVIHCAAYARRSGAARQFWKTNVDGASRLLDAAHEAGVRRFIYMGAEAALFRGQHLCSVDEDYPYPKRTPYLHAETKAAAERAVLAANRTGFETLSIRPRLVWGPGDRALLPMVESLVRSSRFAWINEGRAHTSTTHIDNLVHAVTLALSGGLGGHAYFIADDDVTTVREFLTALLATRGLAPPDRSVPAWLARSAGAVTETLWRMFRRESAPPITRFAAAMFSCDYTVRTDKARRDLGYTPVIARADGLAALMGS